MSASLPSLETRDVSRRFGRVWALRRFSADFHPGTLTMVVGHDGTGKSTLLKLLAGIIRPTEGEISVMGCPLEQQGTSRQNVAYLGHEPGVYGELTAVENLQFFARLYGQTMTESACHQLLDRFALTRAIKRPVRTYSRGMTQRLALARIEAQGAAIWLLDEPMTGLDSAGRDVFVEWLNEAKQSGKTVVTITHAANILEPSVDRVLSLESGRLKGGK